MRQRSNRAASFRRSAEVAVLILTSCVSSPASAAQKLCSESQCPFGTEVGPCVGPNADGNTICMGYANATAETCEEGFVRCEDITTSSAATIAGASTTTTAPSAENENCGACNFGSGPCFRSGGICRAFDDDGTCPSGYIDCASATSAPSSTPDAGVGTGGQGNTTSPEEDEGQDTTLSSTSTTTTTVSTTTLDKGDPEDGCKYCKFGSGPCIDANRVVCRSYGPGQNGICPTGYDKCSDLPQTTSVTTVTTIATTETSVTTVTTLVTTPGTTTTKATTPAILLCEDWCDEEKHFPGSEPCTDPTKCAGCSHCAVAATTPTTTMSLDSVLCPEIVCKFGNGPCRSPLTQFCRAYVEGTQECPNGFDACADNEIASSTSTIATMESTAPTSTSSPSEPPQDANLTSSTTIASSTDGYGILECPVACENGNATNLPCQDKDGVKGFKNFCYPPSEGDGRSACPDGFVDCRVTTTVTTVTPRVVDPSLLCSPGTCLFGQGPCINLGNKICRDFEEDGFSCPPNFEACANITTTTATNSTTSTMSTTSTSTSTSTSTTTECPADQSVYCSEELCLFGEGPCLGGPNKNICRDFADGSCLCPTNFEACINITTTSTSTSSSTSTSTLTRTYNVDPSLLCKECESGAGPCKNADKVCRNFERGSNSCPATFEACVSTTTTSTSTATTASTSTRDYGTMSCPNECKNLDGGQLPCQDPMGERGQGGLGLDFCYIPDMNGECRDGDRNSSGQLVREAIRKASSDGALSAMELKGRFKMSDLEGLMHGAGIYHMFDKDGSGKVEWNELMQELDTNGDT